MTSFKDTLELVLHADASGAINELKRFSSETEKNVKSSESSLKRLSSTGLKFGAAGMGVGSFLTAMADKDVAAANQLKAAIGSAGQSYEDFKDRIDKAVDSQAKFGHTDDEVNNALTTLVSSYGDAGAALDRMQLVADLAAEKHISLADAANIVAKAHGGAGRIFKEFNIQVGQNADGTKNYEGALDQLSQKVDGQASASMAGLTGWLKATGAEAENLVSDFGQKFGPAILGTSTLITGLSGAAKGAEAAFRSLGGAAAATESLLALGPLALPLAAALPLVAFGIEESGKRAAQAKNEVERYAAAYRDTTHALEDNLQAATAANLAASAQNDTIKKSGVDLRQLADEVTNTTGEFNDFKDSVLGTAPGVARFADVVKAAKDSTDPFVRSLVDAYTQGRISGAELQVVVRETMNLSHANGEGKSSTDALTDATKALGGETDTTKQSFADYRQEVKKTAKAVGELDDAYRRIIDSTLDSFNAAIKLSDAQIATRDSIDKLNKAQQDGTTTADQLNKAQNDVFQAILDEAQANEANADAQAKANGKTLDARDAQSAVIEELLKVADTLAPGSELRNRIADYISQLQNNIPEKVNTSISVDADPALKELAKVQAALDLIKQGLGDSAVVGPGFDVTPPGYVPQYGGPPTGPQGPTVGAPGPQARFGQAPITLNFHAGAIVSNEPVQTAYEIAQHHRAAAFLGG